MRRRRLRIVGTLLVVGGLGLLAWAFVVWGWEDPFTGLYGTYRQPQLASQYEERLRRLPPVDLDDGVSPKQWRAELVYVAGHRTTYTAPFSHIERLRRGDLVVLEVPYATLRYRITGREVVPKDAVGRLRSRGREELRLQASHPRFFSSHRYLAYAVPDRVRPRGTERFYDLWP